MLSQQEMQMIFNRVKSHLHKQNQKAQGESGLCSYRTHGAATLKCAIGCLIDDENYEQSLEGRRVMHKDVLHAVEQSLNLKIEDDDVMFFVDLQDTHDLSPIEDWPDRLDRFAEIHKLVA
ncbi:hypothetical protein E4H12_05310 [Candidatus Thorarchaeota archaeon]|nr:MAG: hypothetical protein E4H12_05310 [Candidatus Thorarchaeota archaeon]